MVVATALLGMVTMILTTLNERRREMAILRSVGARPATILGLLATEAGLLTLAGVRARRAAALRGAGAAAALHRPRLRPASRHRPADAARVADARRDRRSPGSWPGCCRRMRAYRLSLADGMTVRT